MILAKIYYNFTAMNCKSSFNNQNSIDKVILIKFENTLFSFESMLVLI